MIKPRQIKAARAYLNWGQEDLADATGISVTTICKIESGQQPPRHQTAKQIQDAFEKKGLEFTEREGIRVITKDVLDFQGPDSFEQFLDDVAQTVKDKGGEVIIALKSPDLFLQSDMFSQSCVNKLNQLADVTNMRCLLSESLCSAKIIPSLHYRIASDMQIGAASYFVYGNKHAILLAEGDSSLRIVVINCTDLSLSYRKQFSTVWEIASPHIYAVETPSRRASVKA